MVVIELNLLMSEIRSKCSFFPTLDCSQCPNATLLQTADVTSKLGVADAPRLGQGARRAITRGSCVLLQEAKQQARKRQA